MISKFHYITQEINGYSHADLACQACESGVRWVQLRVKNKPADQWLQLALETKEICQRYDARLIINDSVELALKVQADGVHLGKNDMNPAEARKLAGKNMIIGGTANTLDDIVKLQNAGVDYIGLGPYRFTSTKEKLSPILGLEGYQNILSEMKKLGIHIPVIAIGGIVPDDVDAIMTTGVYGIAVSSAVNTSTEKQNVINTFYCKLGISQLNKAYVR